MVNVVMTIVVSDIGDDHKEYFAGEAALKAGGKDNTMNQFSQAA